MKLTLAEAKTTVRKLQKAIAMMEEKPSLSNKVIAVGMVETSARKKSNPLDDEARKELDKIIFSIPKLKDFKLTPVIGFKTDPTYGFLEGFFDDASGEYVNKENEYTPNKSLSSIYKKLVKFHKTHGKAGASSIEMGVWLYVGEKAAFRIYDSSNAGLNGKVWILIKP